MKVVHFVYAGRLLTVDKTALAKPVPPRIREYQKVITIALQTRNQVEAADARIVDETWRKMLIQTGKFPLPSQ